MQQRIPRELVDEIIDMIANYYRDRNLILSAIALVGRSCRLRANVHRFSELELFVYRTPTDRLRALQALMESNIWPQGEGVAYHIKSLSLWSGVYYSKEPLLGTSRDSSIVSILSHIFPSNKVMNTLKFGSHESRIPRPGIHSADYRGDPFTVLSADVLTALHNLCRNPNIYELSLHHVWDVPNILVLSSTVTHLSIDNVRFISSETALQDIDCLSQNLKTVQIQHSPSFFGMVLGSRKFAIDRLTCRLAKGEGYEILSGLTRSLVKLTIIVDEDLDVPSSAIDRGHLTVLNVLCFQMKYEPMLLGKAPSNRHRHGISHIDDQDDSENAEILGDDTEQLQRPPLFNNIFNLLPTNLPPVLEIHLEVSINYYSPPETSFDALDHIFSRTYYAPLVDYLEHISSSQNLHLTITPEISFSFDCTVMSMYDPHRFSLENTTYMRGLLSRLDSGILASTLNIDITSDLPITEDKIKRWADNINMLPSM